MIGDCACRAPSHDLIKFDQHLQMSNSKAASLVPWQMQRASTTHIMRFIKHVMAGLFCQIVPACCPTLLFPRQTNFRQRQLLCPRALFPVGAMACHGGRGAISLPISYLLCLLQATMQSKM